MPRRRRRRDIDQASLADGTFALPEKCARDVEELSNRPAATPSNKRACPVPKPSGLIGEVLGFVTKGAPSKPPGRPIRPAQVVNTGGVEEKAVPRDPTQPYR